MRKTSQILTAALIILTSCSALAATQQPVVLELFTSQGCSSCPPADALLRQLSANDPSLLPLSFHVHYWDYLGWKDPFSSESNTNRQRGYAHSLSAGQVFTPQLIVNGGSSAIGSQEGEVREAIAHAKQTPASVDVSITPDPATGKLTVAFTAMGQTALHSDADIWGISFNRHSKTNVANGENSGRMLESMNNVIEIKRLGVWHSSDAHLTLQLDPVTEDGTTIIVQATQQGRILGAAAYLKTSPNN